MMVNIAYAVLAALKVAVKETRSAPGSLKGLAVEKVIQELLHVRNWQDCTETRTDICSFSSFYRILTCVILQLKR